MSLLSHFSNEGDIFSIFQLSLNSFVNLFFEQLFCSFFKIREIPPKHASGSLLDQLFRYLGTLWDQFWLNFLAYLNIFGVILGPLGTSLAPPNLEEKKAPGTLLGRSRCTSWRIFPFWAAPETLSDGF